MVLRPFGEEFQLSHKLIWDALTLCLPQSKFSSLFVVYVKMVTRVFFLWILIMCLSSETLAWGVINCGEGVRISDAVSLQMIPASNVEASNSYTKTHAYKLPTWLWLILSERHEGGEGLEFMSQFPTSLKGNCPKYLQMLLYWPTVCRGPFIKQ